MDTPSGLTREELKAALRKIESKEDEEFMDGQEMLVANATLRPPVLLNTECPDREAGASSTSMYSVHEKEEEEALETVKIDLVLEESRIADRQRKK